MSNSASVNDVTALNQCIFLQFAWNWSTVALCGSRTIRHKVDFIKTAKKLFLKFLSYRIDRLEVTTKIYYSKFNIQSIFVSFSDYFIAMLTFASYKVFLVSRINSCAVGVFNCRNYFFNMYFYFILLLELVPASCLFISCVSSVNRNYQNG